jgi:hypothetical protein
MKMRLGALLLFTVAATTPALAHEAHCHKVGDDGKLVDAPDAKTKKECAAMKGVWEHHHAHCHKNSPDGKHKDLKSAKTPEACEKQGGTWTDHGHEQAAGK